MSATTEVLHATIRATDESSSTLADIAASVKKLQADTIELRKETHRAAIETHRLAKSAPRFAELNAEIKELRNNFGEWGGEIGRMFPMFAALGSAGSVGGLFELTHQVAETVGQTRALASQLRISADQLRGLKLAAQELDVPFETVTGGIGKLAKVLEATELGKNKTAAYVFQLMGISLRKANGEFKTAAEILPEIAESLSKTKNDSTLANAAMTLFGKSGMQMLPFLMAGKEELEKFQKLSLKFAANLSGEQLEALERYKNSWIELDLAFGVLKTTIGAELAPVLAPVLQQFRDWAMEFAQSESHTHRLREAVTQIRDALENFPWKETITRLENFAKGVNSAVEGTVGWKVALEAVAALIATGFALSLLAPLVTIVKITAEVAKLVGLWKDVEAAAVAAGVAESVAAAKAGAGAAAGGAGGALAGAASGAGAVGLGEIVMGSALFTPLLAALAAAGVAWAAWQTKKDGQAHDWTDYVAHFMSGDASDSPFERWREQYKRAKANPNGEEGFAMPQTPVPRLPNLLINPLRDQGVTPWGAYGSTSFPPAIESPFTYNPAGFQLGAPAAPPVRGQVDVNVKIENLPPGSSVTTTSQGDANVQQTDVGYSNPSGRGW